MDCLRRRTLMIFTLSPRPCLTLSSVTLAPSTMGSPTFTLSPSAIRYTLSNSRVSPVACSIFSSFRVSPSTTRCCLPPLSNIAYIIAPNTHLDDTKQRLAEAEVLFRELASYIQFFRGRDCKPSSGSWQGPALILVRHRVNQV